MAITLPPEIRDTIIDQLDIPVSFNWSPRDWSEEYQERLKALRTLLLVSQDVATRARHYLFRCVHLSFISSEQTEATVVDARRLSLFADIVTSSAKSRNMGVLPHIRKVFLLCYWPDCDTEDESDDELIRGGYEPCWRELKEVESPVAKYWGHLSNVLNVLQENARRIEEFQISSAYPETYDVTEYHNWNAFPKIVQRGIYDLIHSPLLRSSLTDLNVTQFINLPPGLLVGTNIKYVSLYGTPSPDPFPSQVTGANHAPPIYLLSTVDYLLPQVTSLCLGCDTSEPSSKSTVGSLYLIVPMAYVEESVEVDRYEKLGRTLTDFYQSLGHLTLEIQHINPTELADRGVFEVPTMRIDIRGLQKLTRLHIEHCYDDFFDDRWCSAGSGDPSGAPLRNMISILTHCPDTLNAIDWEMGYDFCQVIGPDLKRKMVSEYGELDAMIARKFHRLHSFSIAFYGICPTQKNIPLGFSSGEIEDACKERLKEAFPSLGDRLGTRVMSRVA